MLASAGAMNFGYVDGSQPLKVQLPVGISTIPNDTLAAPMSSSEWALVVNSVAPLLNAEGLRQALTILDSAINNVQRSKALGEIVGQGIADPYHGGAGAAFHNAAVCAMMQVQVEEQQQTLLRELHELPLRSGIKHQMEPAMVAPILPCGKRSHVPIEAPWISSDVKTPAMSEVQKPPPKAVEPANTSSVSKTSNRRRMPQTLSTSLRLLENEDADCLLIVRRIGKLGFKAARSLKRHFTVYGPVVKVLLAHSTARQYCDQQFQVKRRPSNLGFIQMATGEAARRILAQGITQEIEGVAVSVQRFERHDDVDEECETGEGADLGETFGAKFARGISDASTASSSGVASPSMHPVDEAEFEEE